MDKYAEFNEFEICPYNNSHRVEKGTRFQTHLIACSQNYPNVETTRCPFNFTHIIKKPELRYHLLTCPDSDAVKKNIFKVQNPKRFVAPVQAMSTEVNENSSRVLECWDDEEDERPNYAEITNYNGQHFINSDSLSGLKKAQKKKIRQNIAKGLDAFGNGVPSLEETNYQPQTPKMKETPLPTELPQTIKIGHAPERKTRIAANIYNYPNDVFMPPRPPPSPASLCPLKPILPPPGLTLPVLPPMGRGSLFRSFNHDVNVTDNSQTQLSNMISHIQLNDNQEKKEENDDKIDDTIDNQKIIEELSKEKRRAEKKLRQIDVLENKLKNGELLNLEELAKIATRNDLKCKIEAASKALQEYENSKTMNTT